MSLLTPTLQLTTPLGVFFFVGYEQPVDVTFGKVQSTYKHIMIGGGRVIDAMGAGDPDITFSGYFTGAEAEFRARFLEGIAKSGQMLTLTASSYVKQVLVTNFTYGFHAVYPVQYTITFQVIQDLTLPVTFIIPGDLTNTVLSALLEAQDIATLIDNPSVRSSIALALLAVQEAQPLSTATGNLLSNAINATQSAISSVNSAITQTEASIF